MKNVKWHVCVVYIALYWSRKLEQNFYLFNHHNILPDHKKTILSEKNSYIDGMLLCTNKVKLS